MEDEILDKEMDKIFHDEKETLSKLNPSAGELDEERKNYYRCYILVWPQQQSFMLFSPLRSASSDDTATSEKQFASPAAEAEPMTGKMSSVFVRHVDHVRQITVLPCKSLQLTPLYYLTRPGLQTRWIWGIHVRWVLNYNQKVVYQSITIESSLEHSNEDFKHKKSSAGGKHRKSSESGMKKASTAGAPLQGIPEKDQETGGKRTNGNRVTVNNRTLGLRRTMNQLD